MTSTLVRPGRPGRPVGSAAYGSDVQHEAIGPRGTKVGGACPMSSYGMPDFHGYVYGTSRPGLRPVVRDGE